MPCTFFPRNNWSSIGLVLQVGISQRKVYNFAPFFPETKFEALVTGGVYIDYPISIQESTRLHAVRSHKEELKLTLLPGSWGFIPLTRLHRPQDGSRDNELDYRGPRENPADSIGLS